MSDTIVTPPRDGKPIIGAALIATAVASLALLANHPGGNAHDFPGLLQEEAANRVMDAVVHGGFVVVLAIQLVCYAVFAARMRRTAALAALIFFAAGTASLSASLVTDGLVIPAIAAKYLPVPAKYDAARSLFALCGILIGFLMPIGLGFQAAATAAWGWALLRAGAARVAGVAGLVLGALILGGLGAQAANPFVLMGSIAAMALWALAMGVLGVRRVI
jgi:hypothetical protein